MINFILHLRNPYYLSIIGEKIKKLELFQCYTASDINLGVIYDISLTQSKYMTTIVTNCLKFRYNRPLMGMFMSGDIFHATLDKILGDIKGVKKFINDLLVLSKDNFPKNLY